MKTTRKPKVPLNQATRNRLLDEAVDDYAIHTLDSAGRIASWSAGAARLFGHDASEILGRDYACFHTRKDRDAGVPQQALRQADAEGRFETEGWRVRSNGKRFWAQVVIDAIRDSQGQLLGFAQLIHDLSEGRAAKEALRRSQEQFRLLVQSVTDYAIYMLDHRGRITNWNLGAQRIKGYLPEEVIGRHFSCFYTPEDREAGEPARGLAAEVAGRLRSALAEHGQALLVVSGGRSPVAFLEALSEEPLDWSRITLSLADERWVPESHADSNAGLVRRHLLRGEAAKARFIGLYQPAASLEEAAELADHHLHELPLPIDVLVLGMGDDGHTASLFPNSPGLDLAMDPQGTRRCLPMWAPSVPHQRLTLPRAVLAAAKVQLLAIQGQSKLATLNTALAVEDERRMPVRAFLRAPLTIHWYP